MSAGTDYQYDAFGNLTGRSAFAGSAYQGSFTPDANNQDSTSPYDAAGDLLNDGVNSYSYDAEGRITSVSGATAYQYDAEGRWVAVGPVGQMPTTDYLYDLGGTLVTSVGSDFKMVRSSLYVAGSHWADYTQGTGSGGGRTQYRLGDEVGTLVYTFDQNGNPLEQCLSGPFGEALQCSPSVDYTETHFADKKRDQESNLDYMGARLYSSTLGRFMSPDPSGLYYADPSNPQSLNLYSYAQNNPLTNIDPTGLTCQTNSSDGSTYDDLDGNGCATVDQQNADRLKNGQYDARAYGAANAAFLEARDAVSQFVLGGNKAMIAYLPQDPFTLNFQRSLGMQAILAQVKGNCSASSGSGAVGTGEAAVNSTKDHVGGQPSIAEDQLGAFTYSYSQQGGTLNVTVSNPITLNSLAYHALASGSEDVNGNPDSNVLAGDTMAGSGLDRLGRLTGSVLFGRIDQQLQIKAANPCP